MNEWARLVDRYASELKKYELVCAFCGEHLAEGNVNEPCRENGSGGGGGKTSGPTTGGKGAPVASTTDNKG